MPRIFPGIRPDRICDAFLSQNFDLLLSPQVDLSDPEQLDGRQLEFMQKKAKVREGEKTAQPPQIFNKTYRGVTFFSFQSFPRFVSLSSRQYFNIWILFQDFLDFISADDNGQLEEFLGVKITSWQLTKVFLVIESVFLLEELQKGALTFTESVVSAKETTSQGADSAS